MRHIAADLITRICDYYHHATHNSLSVMLVDVIECAFVRLGSQSLTGIKSHTKAARNPHEMGSASTRVVSTGTPTLSSCVGRRDLGYWSVFVLLP